MGIRLQIVRVRTVNNIIQGIAHVVKKSQYVTLTRDDKSTYNMPHDIFRIACLQVFGGEKTEKVLDYLYDGESLIIDFDKEVIKRVVDKKTNYIAHMSNYLNKNHVNNWVEGYEEE